MGTQHRITERCSVDITEFDNTAVPVVAYGIEEVQHSHESCLRLVAEPVVSIFNEFESVVIDINEQLDQASLA